MAYMDQVKKAKIAAALKAVMPQGWKYTLSVKDRMSIYMTIKEAPIDLIAMVNEKNKKDAEFRGEALYNINTGNMNVNQYYLDSAFEGEALKVMEAAKKALYSADFYDHSDVQTDYFDCAYYVHIVIGTYDKPFKVAA